MKLKIKAFNDSLAEMYNHHGHFHEGDAGLDLFIPEEITIPPHGTAPLPLSISCESEGNVPYLMIPRSSISKTPLRMSNSIGLIDGGYRGELTACCDNISDDSYTVNVGQRLFQIVAMDGSPIEFTLVDELSDSSRGSDGFGSTGI